MYHKVPLIFFTAVAHLTQLTWEYFTFYGAITGILNNLTYNESIHKQSYDYLKGHNFFDKRSKIKNIQDFLSPTHNYKELYFLPHEF